MSEVRPSKNKLDPIGTLEDVRRRVEEYEARVISKDVEHNSLSRDRAFLLSLVCSRDETTATPEGVLRWAEESFGPIARNRDERAARLAEEAIEVAQAEGVPLETIKRIADRIYSRPVGELGQEVGGLGITLYALAANCGIDLFGEIDREWKRVLSKSRDWWQRKHAEKVAAGTADLRPIQPEEPTPERCTCDRADCIKCYPPGLSEKDTTLERYKQALQRANGFLIMHNLEPVKLEYSPENG